MDSRSLFSYAGVMIALAALSSGSCASRMERDSTAAERPAASALARTSDQVIRRGESIDVAVPLEEVRLEGPITVRFSGLPQGVRVIGAERGKWPNQRVASYTMRADDSAELVTARDVQVTFVGRGNARSASSFRLTVRS